MDLTAVISSPASSIFDFHLAFNAHWILLFTSLFTPLKQPNRAQKWSKPPPPCGRLSWVPSLGPRPRMFLCCFHGPIYLYLYFWLLLSSYRWQWINIQYQMTRVYSLYTVSQLAFNANWFKRVYLSSVLLILLYPETSVDSRCIPVLLKETTPTSLLSAWSGSIIMLSAGFDIQVAVSDIIIYAGLVWRIQANGLI